MKSKTFWKEQSFTALISGVHKCRTPGPSFWKHGWHELFPENFILKVASNNLSDLQRKMGNSHVVFRRWHRSGTLLSRLPDLGLRTFSRPVNNWKKLKFPMSIHGHSSKWIECLWTIKKLLRTEGLEPHLFTAAGEVVFFLAGCLPTWVASSLSSFSRSLKMRQERFLTETVQDARSCENFGSFQTNLFFRLREAFPFFELWRNSVSACLTLQHMWNFRSPWKFPNETQSK